MEVSAVPGASKPACSICLDVVNESEERSTAKLKCGHEFHLDCIGSAFNAKGIMQCPNCRRVEEGQWLFSNGCRSFSEEFSFDDFGAEDEYQGWPNISVNTGQTADESIMNSPHLNHSHIHGSADFDVMTCPHFGPCPHSFAGATHAHMHYDLRFESFIPPSETEVRREGPPAATRRISEHGQAPRRWGVSDLDSGQPFLDFSGRPDSIPVSVALHRLLDRAMESGGVSRPPPPLAARSTPDHPSFGNWLFESPPHGRHPGSHSPGRQPPNVGHSIASQLSAQGHTTRAFSFLYRGASQPESSSAQQGSTYVRPAHAHLGGTSASPAVLPVREGWRWRAEAPGLAGRGEVSPRGGGPSGLQGGGEGTDIPCLPLGSEPSQHASLSNPNSNPLNCTYRCPARAQYASAMGVPSSGRHHGATDAAPWAMGPGPVAGERLHSPLGRRGPFVRDTSPPAGGSMMTEEQNGGRWQQQQCPANSAMPNFQGLGRSFEMGGAPGHEFRCLLCADVPWHDPRFPPRISTFPDFLTLRQHALTRHSFELRTATAGL